jgi:RNA polymerase sigma factor (TIGR02999 family)
LRLCASPFRFSILTKVLPPGGSVSDPDVIPGHFDQPVTGPVKFDEKEKRSRRESSLRDGSMSDPEVPDQSEITAILEALRRGEPQDARRLLPLVYDELRRLARQRLAREAPGQTLDATALVHEAYVRLIGKNPDQPWDGRAHFFAAAAESMRRVLVESARRKRRRKHGASLARQDVDSNQVAAPESSDELLAVDEALGRLSEVDAAAAELVKLRYFAGLSIPQAADILGVAPRSADRLWAYARAWLRREIEP